jgi:hypothetical protein
MQAKKAKTAKLSILGMLDLVPALASIVAVGLFSAVAGLFRSQKDPASLHLYIAYAVLRKATSRLTPLQLQYVRRPRSLCISDLAPVD